MTETYRITELDNARRNLQLAKARLEQIKQAEERWTRRKRDAAEQVEFWGNKVAFLNAVRGE